MNMPAAVQAYFDADQRNDADALVALFSDRAVVLDEGGRHEGRPSIRRWWTAAKAATNYSNRPIAATTEKETTIVHAQVSGAFPGSPITLRFAFRLDGDAIAELKIKP
ncbi:MAG TPA: nuclear transport factor 2 family protein [Beijerinckiaceae bacterium]|jgi:ketosteroid isomerase-like protein